MPEIIMERVLKWQLMPRIMMLAVTILSYQAVHWFMSLPDPMNCLITKNSNREHHNAGHQLPLKYTLHDDLWHITPNLF